jgi:hypothetical protein
LRPGLSAIRCSAAPDCNEVAIAVRGFCMVVPTNRNMEEGLFRGETNREGGNAETLFRKLSLVS